jgi:uncharacterized membrane protein
MKTSCKQWCKFGIIVFLTVALLLLVKVIDQNSPTNILLICGGLIIIAQLLSTILTIKDDKKYRTLNMVVFSQVWLYFLYFAIPYFAAFMYYAIIDSETAGNLDRSFDAAKQSDIAFIFSLLFVIISIILVFSKKGDEDYKEVLNTINDKIDRHFSKTKIVFESGINEFDDTHILALSNILDAINKVNENVDTHIFAIDNTDPRAWWSDTMTGYLALLSKWQTNSVDSKKRHVSRIFVCKKSELLSPVFSKTVSLHSLMGFKTYVITLEGYDKIYKDLFKTKLGLSPFNKELFLWMKTDGVENKSPIPFNIELNLDGHKTFHDVRCYQSYWEVDGEYNVRNDEFVKTRNYKNYYEESVDISKMKVLFEFVAKEAKLPHNSAKELNHKELPNAYKELVDKLIEKTICCKDRREVNQVDKNNFWGIEIKTSLCKDCDLNLKCKHKCDPETHTITSPIEVSEILTAYYNKL